jgi:hypothetical protein
MKFPNSILSIFSILFFTSTLSASDPLKALSKKLKSDLKDKSVSLGVLNFTYDRGRLSTGSHLVSERLLTYLVQEGATVIEKRLLNAVVGQQRFSQIGITNIDSLKKMGKILGVDAVVVGTLSDRPDNSSTDIAARVIRVETAEVLAAGSAKTPIVWPDLPKSPAVPQSFSPVPEISMGNSSAYRSASINKAIRLDPNEPKMAAGEHMSDIGANASDSSERRHLPKGAPVHLKSYRPAPIPFFLPPTPRISKGGSTK